MIIRHLIKLLPQSSSRIIAQPQAELTTTKALFQTIDFQPQRSK
ncbi:Unknown protein sequence [Pseudomonas syringae pv. maculicola]|nr:Unknown protein sequence [Pseudomonas syringae pv. maculicola]